MDMHSEMIMQEYFDNHASFEKMRDIVLAKIQELLKENGLLVTAVEARVKEEQSLAGKLELKGGKYSSLSDITDILGARVITFYSDEVDKIASLIEQNFEIDWENSVDKRKMLDPDQFGYMSLHYICRIPKSLYFDEAHPEINQFRFEIQMRTALQHVWATAYHDTGYKSDVEVPREYIRALSRLAGVLEIADQQFSQIVVELAEYRRKVKTLVKDGNFHDLSLDGDTFSSYLEIEPFAKLNSKIAAINKAEIQKQSLLPYLTVFKALEFETIGDIENLIANYSDDAYRLAVLQIGGTDLDILSETVGVQNLCLVYIIEQGDGENGVKRFLDFLYGERDRNASSAKRIVEQAKTIDIYGK